MIARGSPEPAFRIIDFSIAACAENGLPVPSPARENAHLIDFLNE